MNYITVRNPMRVLEKELENWVKDLQSPFDSGVFSSRGLALAIDFSEDADGYTVKADLPGVKKEDVEINLTDRLLSIKGERKTLVEEGKESRYHRRETWAGAFERSLLLPETADPSSVSAEMKDGVLTILLKKREEAKPRQISING